MLKNNTYNTILICNVFIVSEYGKGDTEPVVVVDIAIAVVVIEHACIGGIVVIATTIEERISRVGEAGTIV